jgi:hypothetical protein
MTDKAFKRELDALQVGCMYRNNGPCSWIGPLQNYQVNSSNCLL